jgi:hypothetical protein
MPPAGFFFVLLYLYCFVLIIEALPFVLIVQQQNINIHAPGGIRNRDSSRQAPTHPRLRTLGHWDRLKRVTRCFKYGVEEYVDSRGVSDETLGPSTLVTEHPTEQAP